LNFVGSPEKIKYITCDPCTHVDALPTPQRGSNVSPSRKTAEEGGVGAHSLAHNTLKGRRACWSSGMGLGRVDKLHSLTRACTQPTQSG